MRIGIFGTGYKKEEGEKKKTVLAPSTHGVDDDGGDAAAIIWNDNSSSPLAWRKRRLSTIELPCKRGRVSDLTNKQKMGWGGRGGG